MQYKIDFDIRQDADTGEFGFVPAAVSEENGFNASWTAYMLFHDVFEHYFEGTSRFLGDNFANYGGEAVAMGHFLYYMRLIDKRTRVPFNQNGASVEEMAAQTIRGVMADVLAGYDEFAQYGRTFSVNLPVVRADDIDTPLIDAAVNCLFSDLPKIGRNVGPEARQVAKTLRRSLTPAKVRRALMYGYRQAMRIAPDDWITAETFNAFFRFWNDFFREFSAEYCPFYRMAFTVTTKCGVMRWKCELSGDVNVTISSGHLRGALDRIQATIYQNE